MNNKLIKNVELFLQSPKGVKKSWIRTILTLMLCTTLFIIVISLSFAHGPMSGQTAYTTDLGKSFFQIVNAPYIAAGTWISVAGLALLGIPFIYLFSVWMIGINEVSKSKQFHLFMWIIAFIITILAIIAMILLIRASILNINSGFVEIKKPEAEGDAESSTTAFIDYLTSYFINKTL